MDVDTTSGKWAHAEILDRVGRGEVDILLGTQMIAKGLDFPNVTLVGVIDADIGINLPDFRASERSFQLLSQVAGRAGRGPKGGEVIIQTRVPAAPRRAMRGDARLSRLRAPGAGRRGATRRTRPTMRLANVIVSGLEENATAKRGARRGGVAARADRGAVDRRCRRWSARRRAPWSGSRAAGGGTCCSRARSPARCSRVGQYFVERFPVPAAHSMRVASTGIRCRCSDWQQPLPPAPSFHGCPHFIPPTLRRPSWRPRPDARFVPAPGRRRAPRRILFDDESPHVRPREGRVAHAARAAHGRRAGARAGRRALGPREAPRAERATWSRSATRRMAPRGSSSTHRRSSATTGDGRVQVHVERGVAREADRLRAHGAAAHRGARARRLPRVGDGSGARPLARARGHDLVHRERLRAARCSRATPSPCTTSRRRSSAPRSA